MTPVADIIRTKLIKAFQPSILEINDSSALHAGHAGAPKGGESHFRVTLVSPVFAGLSRMERQRKVHDVLRDELAGPVHALSLQLRAPGEK